MTKAQIEAFGKITPGKWKFRRAQPSPTHYFLELWGDNHEISTTAIRKLPDQQKWLNEDESNMQAFAALPDLLKEREEMIAALKEARGMMASMGWAVSQKQLLRTHYEKLVAVLARAEGEETA